MCPIYNWSVFVNVQKLSSPSARSIEESDTISQDSKSIAIDTGDGSLGQLNQRAAVEPSRSAVVADSRSIGEAGGKSEKVTEVEPKVSSSQELEEDSKLKNMKDT